MAKDSDHLAGFEIENTGGFLSGLLAEEDHFDRRSLWRLGSWGGASVGAVILALLVNQSSIGSRREQMASADLARSQQIQSVAKESQDEARRLASAIDTLNGDRDRLYARVTVLEQGLDSVTGAIARQNSTTASPQATTAAAASTTTDPSQPAPQNAAAAPVVSPVAAAPATTAEKPAADAATAARDSGPAKVASNAQAASNSPAATPATPLMPAKSMLAPPDAAAGKLIQPEARANAVVSAPMPEVVASVSPADDARPDASQATPPEAKPSQATPAQSTPPKVTVQRTEFGVDVGGANSVGGLRALWRGLLKSRSNAPLATLRPIIVVKESNSGLGMQLRLVAGPLGDAAAAAKICAALLENERTCETTVFDGQRLAMTPEEPPAAVKPAAARRHGSGKRAAVNEEPPKPPESPSTLSSLFGRR